MDLWEVRWEDVYQIHLSQDRDQWWALVKPVITIWVS